MTEGRPAVKREMRRHETRREPPQDGKHDALPPADVAPPGWDDLHLPEFAQPASFLSGHAVPGRLRIRYYQKRHPLQIAARAWFGPATEGPAGLVHGGAMAAALDEAMGVAVTRTVGRPGLTAELHVRFRKPLTPGFATIIRPSIVARRSRRVVARAVLLAAAGGAVHAEAEAVFVIPPAPGGRTGDSRNDRQA
jgi:acyl-coenzyme A thioesterase PaaI-like protein